MAEIVKETQFKVIKLTIKELQAVEGGYALGICDWCGESSFDGYYIAALNRYYCPKCYEEWLKRAKYYPEDKPIEDKNFNCWKTALGKNRGFEMIDLTALGLTFIGFWDRCFFSNQAANSGITVKDQTGAEHSYSYAELYNMMEKLKKGKLK